MQINKLILSVTLAFGLSNYSFSSDIDEKGDDRNSKGTLVKEDTGTFIIIGTMVSSNPPSSIGSNGTTLQPQQQNNGTLTLSGTNTYSGTTTISGGTLSFSGTNTLTGAPQ